MRKFLLLPFICAAAFTAAAQIPVELFAGSKRSSLDIMFFKNVKTSKERNSTFLFFNRNRVLIDYKQTTTTNLPQFGFTEAVSYQHPRLKGFAPVAVVQLLNRGVFPKAGIQYAHIKNRVTFFGWFVSETMKKPLLDVFVLTRFTPSISSKLKLFTQAEFFNSFSSSGNKTNNFIQRIRMGISRSHWQVGLGVDLSQTGKTDYSTFLNSGIFSRYEF